MLDLTDTGLIAPAPRRRGRPAGSRSFRPNEIIERGDGTLAIVLDAEHHAIIDAEDYPRIKDLRWRAVCGANGWRAEAFIREATNTSRKLYLQRLIADLSSNINVAPLDGDLLNCRKENLTIPGSGVTASGKACLKKLPKREIFRSAHSPTCDWPEDPRYMIIPLGDGLSTIIDADDWPLVRDYAWHCLRIDDRHWYAAAYIRGSASRINGEKIGEKHIYMHRLLVDPATGMYVDHSKTNNSLDNRRSVNLRESTPQENSQSQERDRIIQIQAERIAYLESQMAGRDDGICVA